MRFPSCRGACPSTFAMTAFVPRASAARCFTLRQALELGFSRPSVRRRIESGAWERSRLVCTESAAARQPTGDTSTDGARAVDRWRACRRSARSRSTGSSGRRPSPRSLVREDARTLAAVRQHLDELPRRVDCTDRRRHPGTTAARTLIDWAAASRAPRSRTCSTPRSCSDWSRVDRLRDVRGAVGAAPERVRDRAGAARARHPGLRQAANVWEAKVLRIVRATRASRSREVNYRVQVGGRVRYLDLAWPDAKVAVEFDGFVPHSTRRVFDDDRARQNDLVADGWTVFRVTRRCSTRPERTFRADRCRGRRQR